VLIENFGRAKEGISDTFAALAKSARNKKRETERERIVVQLLWLSNGIKGEDRVGR
jgi:hypothetical protein